MPRYRWLAAICACCMLVCCIACSPTTQGANGEAPPPIDASPTASEMSNASPGPTGSPASTSNADLPDVTLTTERTRYPIDTKEVRATWHNNLSTSIDVGEMFTLDRFVEGEWQSVDDYAEEARMFILPAYIIKPGESLEHVYQIGWYYAKELPKGTYRIGADYRLNAGENGKVTIYAGFEVGDAK